MKTLADRSADVSLGCETLVVLLTGCEEVPSELRWELEQLLFSFMMDPQVETPLFVCSVLTILQSAGEEVVSAIRTMNCSLGRQLYLMGAVKGQKEEKRQTLADVEEMVREVIRSDRNESFKQEIIGGYLFLLQSVLAHAEDGNAITSLLGFILTNQPSIRSLTLVLHVFKKNPELSCIVGVASTLHV